MREKMQNQKLERMYGALRTLGQRKCGNVGADLKVGRMIGMLAPLVEPLLATKERAALEVLEAAPPDVGGIAAQVVNLRAITAQRAVDELEVEVELPVAFALKEADLPKRKKDDAEDPNATGIGNIVADLGPLYLWDEPEEGSEK